MSRFTALTGLVALGLIAAVLGLGSGVASATPPAVLQESVGVPDCQHRTDEIAGMQGMMGSDGTPAMMHGMDGMDGMMSGWMNAVMVLWFVFVIVLIGLAVAALVWAVRQLRGGGSSRRSSPARARALEELDLRYARGEVSREDYQQRRTDLSERLD